MVSQITYNLSFNECALHTLNYLERGDFESSHFSFLKSRPNHEFQPLPRQAWAVYVDVELYSGLFNPN